MSGGIYDMKLDGRPGIFSPNDRPSGESRDLRRPEPLRPRAGGHRARVCADAAGKGAVKTQIKSVVCGFAGERSVSPRNGVLDYKIDFKSFNDGTTVFEYLQNNL